MYWRGCAPEYTATRAHRDGGLSDCPLRYGSASDLFGRNTSIEYLLLLVFMLHYLTSVHTGSYPS